MWPICQYDPIEVIIPTIIPAMALVQKLWAKKISWNDLNLPADILEAWFIWERKLPDLVNITLPWVFGPLEVTIKLLTTLCISSRFSKVHSGFKHQKLMPWLDVCAALTGVQLSSLKTQYQGHRSTPTQLKARQSLCQAQGERTSSIIR